MSLDLTDCTTSGPALPEPFLRFELPGLLEKRGLLPKSGRRFEQDWQTIRRPIRSLTVIGGPLRVANHILAPLAPLLGYALPQRQEPLATREGSEDAGWLLNAPGGSHLRAWSIATDIDLDAPQRSGRGYRFSPMRIASRILLETKEPAALLTGGSELRLLLTDPSRPDSHLAIPLTGTAGWAEQTLAPDSFRLLVALASPAGLAALPDLLQAARLSQARVTKDLRVQARAAVEGFLQAILDDPANVSRLRDRDSDRLARTLWQEALVLIYRLLFILKLESTADPARGFSFAATTLWRQALSPNRALGPLVRRHLDQGHDTGRMLSDGLRCLFRLFCDGLCCSELAIAPLGGALFGVHSMPLLSSLSWSEHAAAVLLDRLLWTMPRGRERERVQYGPLNVEELGRVYEALLELDPGIATRPMLRLRRAKLEVVVPAGQTLLRNAAVHDDDEDDDEAPDNNVVRKQSIQAGQFYLRAGIGRKATGSYYTPDDFVRFLVRETLGPQLAARSPDDDPNPAAILALKVVDPATGSGHFLVQACRFLGDALYAACRQGDALATAAETAAAQAQPPELPRLLARARDLRSRIDALPDPDRSLQAYLPSRVAEGADSGLSQSRALAICRRLVAVHCLYGVDRNPLAVELAKLSLWLESYAEGLPLTFLDHRLAAGDSLGGPLFAQLARFPVGGGELDPLLAHDVAARLTSALQIAMAEVQALQASVGRDAADLVLKQGAKTRLDAVLLPLRQLARAWSGAVMLALREADDEYLALAQHVARHDAWPARLTRRQARLLAAGADALPWDLTFPEVFQPDAAGMRTAGFDVVLGNPPWDIVQQSAKEFLAGVDLSILNAPTRREAQKQQARLLADSTTAAAFRAYQENFERQHRLVSSLYTHQKAANGAAMTGKLDAFRVFAERSLLLAGPHGAIGMVVPSSFHANEGATAIRDAYLQQTDLRCCFSFENRRRLFDIHVRQKFALLVAQRPGPTQAVQCGFYLDDLSQLGDATRILRYDRAFIESSGGSHHGFLELRSGTDFAIARRVFLRHPSLRDWAAQRGIVLGRELNITDDADRLTPLRGLRHRPHLLLHEGKTIQQFDDRWDAGPRYGLLLSDLQDKPAWQQAARYYRLAVRKIARSTDERTAIAAFTSPGYLVSITANVERAPHARCDADALVLCAIINSFVFDWSLRQKTAATVNLFLLEACPVCEPGAAARFLAHGALRLSCNHAAYAPLWQQQLGRRQRETTTACTWPVVATPEARWQLRAAMDALVAHAYRITRSDYEHILGSFVHKRFPLMPILCLAAFDAIAAQGVIAFCRAHDPYDDIPLPTALSVPRDLPGMSGSRSAAA